MSVDNYDETVAVDEMEEELRQCLRHVPAPEGFTERVMVRTVTSRAVSQKGRVLRFPGFAGLHRRPGWWSAIAAALLLTAGGDMVHVYRVHEAQKQSAAQHQVDLAMQITNRALDQVGEGLERSHAAKLTQIALELSK